MTAAAATSAKTLASARLLIIGESIDSLPQDFLESNGYAISLANDSLTALNLLAEENPDLILLEASFSEVAPAALCELLRVKRGHLP
ncbi:MAG TPA: hypothetical protein VEX64_02705, partial [Pyrinomonadaceae bacterium]|nr:hypothetical protein [Pyrinomonadaceae bacterium]